MFNLIRRSPFIFDKNLFTIKECISYDDYTDDYIYLIIWSNPNIIFISKKMINSTKNEAIFNSNRYGLFITIYFMQIGVLIMWICYTDWAISWK